VLFKYLEALKNHEAALSDIHDRMLAFQSNLGFSLKTLAKPRQIEVLDEQLKMVTGKRDSISSEFARAREILERVTDEAYLQGLEGLKDQRNIHEMREDEILLEI
jgi:citrate lyase beta subunit